MTLIEKTLGDAIGPGLALLPAKMTSPAALVMLLAIGLQESGLTARAQVIAGGGKGPARGLWQFEQSGGVKGVLTHPATAALAAQVCDARAVEATPAAVWARLEGDDVLAAAFARLLLYSDPKPLPVLTDSQGGWDLYVRVWRPGKPRPAEWPAYYSQALHAI